MDRPSTYQLLAILRDARIEGRDADVVAVLDEIGVDVEPGALACIRASWPATRPHLMRQWLIDQAPDADALAEALEANRMERLRCIVDQFRCERMEWIGRRPIAWSIYKQRYSSQGFSWSWASRDEAAG
jgi:hypothetical protein